MNQRRTHPYTNISGIIFDVDNTLYRQTPDILQGAGDAFCKAVKTHLGSKVTALDEGYILMLGNRSLRESGDACTLLSKMPGASHKALHRHFHRKWDAGGIPRDEALINTLTELAEKGMKLYAYSDAHQDWTCRALDRVGTRHLFDRKHIKTRDKIGTFCTKKDGADGYQDLIKTSGLEPNQLVMVDDSEANLIHAKALGMVTVLITHGKTPTMHPKAYDFAYNNVHDFLTDFNQHHEHSQGAGHRYRVQNGKNHPIR